MSYGIEIGCMEDPQICFSQLCDTVNISKEYFTLIEKSDIYWAWEVKSEYIDVYMQHRSEIQEILSGWIKRRKVRYASW